MLIARGRDLGDIENQKGKNWDTTLEIARYQKNTEVVSVLERFIANQALTRHEVRGKYGVLDELAAELHAVMVFL